MHRRNDRLSILTLALAFLCILASPLFGLNAEKALAETTEFAPPVSYLYLDNSVVSPGTTLNIVLSFDDDLNTEDAKIIALDDSGAAVEIPLVGRSGGALLFSRDFGTEEVGTYTASELDYTLDGANHTLQLSEYGIDASFTVSTNTSSDTVTMNREDPSIVTLTGDDIDSGTAASALEESIVSTLAQTPSTVATDDGDLVIVIDPGHGGRDPGALGYGLQEADLNLKIAKYLKQELDKYAGIEVYLTRTSDTDFCKGSFVERTDLQGRVDFAKAHNADIFVCLHINAAGGQGAMVFYPNKNGNKNHASEDGEKLAQEIQDELASLGLRDNGIIKWDDELYVIRHCKEAGIASVLVEHCFIDSSSDVNKFLKSESGLKKLALADARGIIQAYGLTKDTWVKPALYVPSATTSGPKISWKSVKNATGYAIYRKPSGGSWKMIDTTGSTSYVDQTQLEQGKTYYYTVRAYKGTEEEALANKYDEKFWTTYSSAGVKVVCLPTPTLKTTLTASAGIKVKWDKATGASGYAVYRKPVGGSWKMVGTTTSTSYVDKSLPSAGKTYCYTVRAYHGSASTATSNKYDAQYWSGYDATGIEGIYYTAPKLREAIGSGTGRKLSWNAVPNASGYAVYRKPAGGDWKMIDTTTSTSYVDDEALSAGATYYYTVRAYMGALEDALESKYLSASWSHFDSAGLRATSIGIPQLKTASTASTGIKISWEKAAGASGYAVYRKPSGGSWKMIATTTATGYTDKSKLSNGATYAYTVRAYHGDVSTAKKHKYSARYWSSYDGSGVLAKLFPTPVLKSEEASSEGATITWGAVPNASGYAVYSKPAGGSWAMFTTTTNTSYTETAEDLVDGDRYSYTVRAYFGDIESALAHKYESFYWSHFDSKGLSTTHLDTPRLLSATKSEAGVHVSWEAVPGASGYAIYRKPSGGSWGMITTTSSTEYTNRDADADTCSYTVRAYVGDTATAKKNKHSSLYWSGFDDAGIGVDSSDNILTQGLRFLGGLFS